MQIKTAKVQNPGREVTMRGLTKLEILVMLTIFVLLGFVTVSNILQARVNVNELAAKNSLKELYTACESYRTNQNPPAYPKDLEALARAKMPYIEETLARAGRGAGVKNGYVFNYLLINPDQYSCIARPFKPGVSGRRVFFMDQSGVIRLNNSHGHPIE